MPDKWEMLIAYIESALEIFHETILDEMGNANNTSKDKGYKENIDYLQGKIGGLEDVQDFMDEIDCAIEDFEDTVSGSGG